MAVRYSSAQAVAVAVKKAAARERKLAKRAVKRLMRMGEPARFIAGSVTIKICDHACDTSAITYTYADANGAPRA